MFKVKIVQLGGGGKGVRADRLTSLAKQRL